MEQIRALCSDVFVDPGPRRHTCQQYQQSADPITAGSKGRLMVARIIESPMAGLQLSPRQQDHEKAGRDQSQSRQPSHSSTLSAAPKRNRKSYIMALIWPSTKS